MVVLATIIGSTCLIIPALAHADVKEGQAQQPAFIYTLTNQIELPLDPETAFDVMTGDISGWWDHSFSENPALFVIEPWAGGGFKEVFVENENDGVLHATVNVAIRGKVLRFTGPLGLSGQALNMVHTWSYEATETGSLVKLEVHISGEIDYKTATIIDGVWNHFLHEGLRSYIDSGAYKEKLP